MSKEAHFVVLRHARPGLGSQEDPGLDIGLEDLTREIDDKAWTISTILEDSKSPRLEVFSSPKRRAVETAQELIATKYLRSLVTGQVIIDPRLDAEAFDDLPIGGPAIAWADILRSIAEGSLPGQDVSGDGDPTFLIVTHEPLIRALAPQYHHMPNPRELGITEFRAKV